MSKQKTSRTPSALSAVAASTVPAASLISRAKTLVFVSHDSRDADLAEAFANLLSDVSAGTLKSFRSSDKKGTTGIEFGTEWYQAIMSQLGDATDVVALLTPRSVDRPWILYEAGVAKGKLDTNVLGIALGVPLAKVSSGPFGQFQNCGDDEDSLTKLVLQLLQRNPDAAPREAAVRMQVTVFRERAAKLFSVKDKDVAASAPTEETSIAKLFEEVKVMVRELPERVDDRVRHASRRSPLHRMRRIHPMMLEELLTHPAVKDLPHGTAITWLFFISLFRDDFPWVYEIGLEVYKALRSRDQQAIADAREGFVRILEATTKGPFSREFLGREDEHMYFLIRHLPELIVPFLARAGSTTDDDSPPRRSRLRSEVRPPTQGDGKQKEGA